MLVSDLIKRLQDDVPEDWNVRITGHRSLEVWTPDRTRYGFVFMDDRPTRFLTDRKVDA